MSAKTNNLTVTIIVPAYNEEEGIAACLESCLNQTVMPDEVLVVDNNSTDKTLEIIKDIQKRWPKVVRILHQSVQGLIPTRNLGFDEAKGEIMGRIDADSRLEPGWVEALKDIFSDETIMAATGPSFFYDSPPAFKKVATNVHRFIAHGVNEKIAGHKMLWGSNMALRKSAWHKIKANTCNVKDIIEDLDLAIHCDEAHLKMHFDERLLNSISPRRYLSSVKGIYNYLNMWPRTYEIHGNTKAVKLTKAIIPMVILGTYVPTNLGLRGYDPVSDSFSMKKFVNHSANERENP